MDLIFTVKGYHFDNLLKEHSTIEEVVENLDHRINALRLELVIILMMNVFERNKYFCRSLKRINRERKSVSCR